MSKVDNKVCLVVIDGWGISPNSSTEGDAIRNGDTPIMDRFESEEKGFTQLSAHGLSVGLPDGLMGNSEVGHLNIGAGRVVYQDIVRIDLALKKKQFGSTENIKKSFQKAIESNGRLHLLGLISDGGVHSHINHLFGLLEAAKEAKVPEVFIHFFGDGRDTNPKSAVKYAQQLQEHLDQNKYGKIGTVIGRYYAMDRDKRWERIEVAVKALIEGKGEKSDDLQKTLKERYDSDETDEFLKPIILNEDSLIKENDTLLFFNYRSDRMREITQIFGVDSSPVDVKIPKNLDITTFTQYKTDYPFNKAFPPQVMDNVLADWLSQHKVKQIHIAETEKYAHVTFFFNGGVEIQYDLEDRDLINSPKVATYDLKPEMSAIEVGEKVAERILEDKHEFVMCNFAPPDMVGHTGKYEEAIKGCEATDKAIGIIEKACKEKGYVLFVTADHGNAEKMISEEGGPHTAHTTAKVPFVMSNTDLKFKAGSEGALCDVAPTILATMGLPKPKEMDGESLLA
ncbi:2,3-bisphosphoglycerate-independent phosphoglycerate mutase [Neoconidiobolus thromboides FSU 785]|nr:2,3-bisphosphoglycerate-independent phosphoglycerate mutase [Neoconidiobolus thromboides FSU 785]